MPNPKQKAESIDSLNRELGNDVRICILGSTEFKGATTQELVACLASQLDELSMKQVCFITGGRTGVQQTFAENCRPDAKLWNLVPTGHQSEFCQGQDLHVGNDRSESADVFAKIGDIYITFEGGPGVAREATTALEGGAAVVPMRCTGGASSGMFNFPKLDCPCNINHEQWALLGNCNASVQDVATAAVAIIERLTTNRMIERKLLRRYGIKMLLSEDQLRHVKQLWWPEGKKSGIHMP